MTETQPDFRTLYFRTLTVIAAFATAAAVYYLRRIIFLIFLALLTAIFLSYLSSPLEKRLRFPRWLAIIATLIVLSVLLGVLGFFLTSPLANQATSLVDKLPDLLERARAYIITWIDDFGNWAPQVQTQKFAEEAVKFAGSVAAKLIQIVTGGIGLITDAITVLVLGVFLAIERRQAIQAFCHLFRNRSPEEMSQLAERAVHLIRGWMLGQVAAMLFLGAFTTIAFWITGIDYFLVFGALAALFSVIPYLGLVLTALGPLTWAVFTDPSKIIWVLVIWLASQLLEGSLISPLIMHRYVHLSPFIVIIGILVMGSLFGFLGVVVAVPLTAITCVLLGEVFPWWKGKMPQILPATEEGERC